MKLLSIVCAMLLVAAGFGGAASAAPYEGAANMSPVRGLETPAASAKQPEPIRVADFGAGLAVGFIGGLITGHVKHRHYGYHRHYHRRGRYHRRHYRGCRHWRHRCARNWGHGNRNYRGCMRYHGCR